MSDDKFKGYDFDGDDPFDDGPFNDGGLEDDTPAPASPELGEQDSAQPMMDEPKQEERAAPARKKSGGGIVEFLKENWIMGVGGIVVILVGYYMYNMIFPSAPSRPQHRVEHRAAHNQGFGLTSQPIKLPGRPAAPAGLQKPVVTHAAPVVDAVTITRADLKQMVAGFSKIVQDNNRQLSAQIQKIGSAEQSISTLSSKDSAAATAALSSQNKVLNRLSGNIADLQKQLTSTNKNMETITKSIIRTQTQLRVLLAQKSQDKDRLSLRAVVPGRAWLVDQSGKTMTVAVGAKIKNYGTVEKVDSKNAQVIMSSGYVFN